MSNSQQSWTAWLFGSQDIIHSPDSSSAAGDEAGKASPTTAPRASSVPPGSTLSSASLPYGPYVKTGRGGAGNFAWQPATDTGCNLEAQKPVTIDERQRDEALTEHVGMAAAMQTNAAHRPAPKYVRVGRGFIQNGDLQQAPKDAENTRAPAALSSTSVPTTRTPGRGGAGNFAAATAAKHDLEVNRQEEEKLQNERRRELVVQEVESKLMPPPDAWIGRRS